MKFRCGDCGTYYLVEGIKKLRKKQSLRCIACDNVFVVQPDQRFFSSKRNSQLICNSCGQFVEEADGVCSCDRDAAESSAQEAQRIDNKEYQFFIVRKGRIQPKYKRVNWFARGLLLAGAITLATGIIIVVLMPSSKRDALKNTVLKTLHIPSKTETQVVIMRSGKVYYAEHIEYNENKMSITTKEGNLIFIRKQDIQQIRKAVIED